MADFNTHGGYFSPAGYMRINEGGSHEENPNGGVQVGVDPQGVPNILEEGEPVYKDFVFSDNIKAQEQFLVEAGLPKRFAGKLYSEIVDELFAEAEERPNDPISRNGLDAMLSRVARAQEAQKESEEEAQLMEEIQKMSPEEYAALEQAMMAQEQPVEQPMPDDEMVAPEQMAVAPEEQMQPEMMPTGYANGGFLDGVRHFLNGPDSFVGPDGKEYPILKGEPPIVGKAVGAAKKVKGAVKAAKEAKQIAKNTKAALEASVAAEEAAKTARVAHPWLRKVGKGLAWGAGLTAGAGLVGAGIRAWSNPDVEGSVDDYVFDPNDFKLGGNMFPNGGTKLPIAFYQDDTYNNSGYYRNPYGMIEPAYVVESRSSVLPMAFYADDTTNRSGYYRPNNIPGSSFGGGARGVVLPDAFYEDDTTNNSGYQNTEGRTILDTTRDIYTGGYFRPTAPNNIGYVFYPQSGSSAVADDDIYRNPNTGEPVSTGTVHIERVLPEAEVIGYSTPKSAARSASSMPSPGVTVSVPGHMSDAELDMIVNGRGDAPLPAGISIPRDTLKTGSLVGYKTPAERIAEVNVNPVTPDVRESRSATLSTLPRYAGAIGSGLLALNTLLQQPDHYDDTPIRPALPTGRILLQDQRYMPLDQNAVTNQMQAQNTANARAIMNSGAGPSTGALIAAADYTGGFNLGNALANVWQANNQERNRVISANNQNAATRAQFYRDLNSQRAQILNNMALYNRQNALRTAMLNNQAEQAKYNAFGQNLGNALQALSRIGQENFAMNQLNTNTALGWYVGPDGRAYYRGPNWNNCGGLLKKNKK